jgi:chorismate mutase
VTAAERDLAAIRAAIDEVDDEIVRLLVERTRLALEAGAVKRAAGVPIPDAERERAVIARAVALASPPLEARAVEAIFARILEESRARLLRES